MKNDLEWPRGDGDGYGYGDERVAAGVANEEEKQEHTNGLLW